MTDVPERLSETFAALALSSTRRRVGDFCLRHREAIAEALALREDPRTARALDLLEVVEMYAAEGAFAAELYLGLAPARLDESEGTHE